MSGMGIIDSLKQIRSTWLTKISHHMARGEGVRAGFLEELNQFYDLLLQAIESGDPTWMDSLLDGWVEARTQTDLQNRDTSLAPILESIWLETFNIARENLDKQEALELISSLMPLYTHSLEYSISTETRHYIEYVSAELEKAKNKLEKLDKSKSDFISIAAHELKTPLTLIEGYAAMLKEQIGVQRATQADIYLKGLDNGTRRLREIIDDMIDVSMIDNSLLSLNFQPLWLNRLFKVLSNEFQQSMSERNLMFTINPFPGSDEMTFGDSERLYQAFRNLIANAIKFTPDGGKIVIDGRKLPGFVEVTFQDTGIGIDPQDNDRIFEKFGRTGSVSLHSSGKTKFKGGGPGLGLPITKGIIEAHGGAIWVESPGYDEEKCPGAIFHVLLPIQKEPPDPHAAKLYKPLTEGIR
jgi:signal transduction histidine kinase